jgi:hypothetical protein
VEEVTMRRRADNPGFVLLMALAILVIAGTILAASARRCCRRAIDAGSAQRDLQVRWGGLTLQAVCGAAAEELLEEASAKLDQPVSFTVRQLALGGMTFHVVVCDEQAKANVNMLTKLAGDRGVSSSLMELQSGSAQALHVVTRPDDLPKDTTTTAPASATALPMVYGSYEQLFEFTHPSELFERGSLRPAAVRHVTCWGSGRLNFKRAERAAMREVLAGSLDESDLANILTFRRKQPDCTLGELLRELNLPGPKAQAASERLTDSSTCHALWIVAEMAEVPTRKWYRLFVTQAGGTQGDEQQWVCQW